MSQLLFSLRGVPEDEAWDIRTLLSDHGIEFYETSAGNWGISMPAIWLKNDADLQRARQLIDVYQHQRAVSQREIYLQLKRQGQHKTIWTVVKENPLRFFLYLALIYMVLYISIKLFLDIGG